MKKEKKNKKQEDTAPKRQLWKHIILVCVVLMLLSSCIAKYSNDAQNAAEDSDGNTKLALELTMYTSTHILTATYCGADGEEMLFVPGQSYKGTLDGEETELIYVRYEDGDIEELGFEEGTEYLIFQTKTVSVYYTHTRFYLQSTELITEETPYYQEYLEDSAENAEITASIADYSGVAFSTTTDIEELAEFASNIFVVSIDSIYATGTATNVYTCTVTQVLKAEQDPADEITIPFFVDTVTVGEEYVVLLGDATDTAPIYTIAAKTGAFYTLDEAQSIEVLARLLND